MALGRVSSDDASRQLTSSASAASSWRASTLERLVDNSLQAKLAADNGITVISDAEIDQQMTDLGDHRSSATSG